MHFDFLPGVKHNEEAIHEYERGENNRIKRWLARIIIPFVIMLAIAWLVMYLR